MDVTREFCAENLERVPAAVRAGATRVELCDNLAAGGTTPSYGVIRAAVAFQEAHGVPMMVMCRPRGGGFVYTDAEVQMMVDDVRMARASGAAGVVIGCLRRHEGALALDREVVARLVDEAKGEGAGIASGTKPVLVTFHMAFDELVFADQEDALDTLASLGVERVLTHGGPASRPIADNLVHLHALVAHARDRIAILPGGGVTYENVDDVTGRLGVREAHGTRIVDLG